MANVSKRGDSYRIKVSCGYDVNGKQVIQSKTWRIPENMTERQIKKELERQVVMFEEACKMGKTTASIKFQTFADQWLEEYAKPNLRKSSYNSLFKYTNRTYPAIGHLRLDKITSRDIQKFISDLMANGKSLRTGKPLSRKTVLHHLGFISDVFSYAVKMDMVADNPCRKVSVPKAQKKEKAIYTIDEIRHLFALLETAPLKYKSFIILAVYSGFRRGELLGLEWKDIDWDNGVISVRRTSNYNSMCGIYTDTTKTKRSQRSSKFPPFVMNILEDLKNEQEEQRKMMGDKWVESDRLFTKVNGTPIHPGTHYQWFKKFCEKNNFRMCDLHSLRHFHASLLIFSGVDPAAVSADLGHSTISTTTGFYVHMFQEAQARTSSVIANALNFGTNDREEKAAG